MLIREASPFDIPELVRMLRRYKNLTPLEFLSDLDNEDYIVQLLTQLMAGRGVVLIAEKEGVQIGMLIGCISPSLWSNEHLLLTEMAYWVEPEYRGGTAGYRLLAEYCEIGKKMKQEGRICNFMISKMSNSPDLQYQRFGFQKLEEFWVM